MPDRIPRIECQNECQNRCSQNARMSAYSICQKVCQNRYQIERQKECQIECQDTRTDIYICIYMTQAFIALHTQREHPFLLAGRLRNRLAIGGNFVSCSRSKVLKVNIAFWQQFFPMFCVHTIWVGQKKAVGLEICGPFVIGHGGHDTSIHCPAHSKGAPFSLGWPTAQSSRYWWELRKLLTPEGSESEHCVLAAILSNVLCALDPSMSAGQRSKASEEQQPSRQDTGLNRSSRGCGTC